MPRGRGKTRGRRFLSLKEEPLCGVEGAEARSQGEGWEGGGRNSECANSEHLVLPEREWRVCGDSWRREIA